MNQPPTYYYILQISVPALMIAAGWYVVHQNALRIERRKEAREFVEYIEKLIDEIYEDVTDYFLNGNCHIGQKSASIKANFQLVSHYLFILKGLGLDPKCGSLLTRLRKISTGGFFETKNFKKQVEIPGWDAELAESSAQIKLAIRQSYYRWTKHFKPLELPKRTPWPPN